MALYMDIHKGVEGLTADAVAGAHEEGPRGTGEAWGEVFEILVQ